MATAEKVTLTFLGSGTSQGVPVITCDCEVCLSTDKRDDRTRASVLFEVNEKVIVVDTGPDFRTQMLRESVQRLDAILYTHDHKDHVAGMDDIRAFFFKQKRPIPIFASAKVQACLKREYPYVFVEKEEDRYPGAPSVNLHPIDSEPFNCEGVLVTPIKVRHGKPFIHGFRIGDITYITDANYISEEEIEKIKGSRVLVLNALRPQPHHSHFTLGESLEMVKRINPEVTYLTHISHLLGTHKAVEAELPKGVFLAYDGLKV